MIAEAPKHNVTTTMTTMLRPDGVRHVPYALRSRGRNEKKMKIAIFVAAERSHRP